MSVSDEELGEALYNKMREVFGLTDNFKDRLSSLEWSQLVGPKEIGGRVQERRIAIARYAKEVLERGSVK